MNMKKHGWTGALWCAVVLTALASGCATKKPRVGLSETGNEEATRDHTGLAENGGNVGSNALTDRDLQNVQFSVDGELQTVYFDFDSAVLRPDALATLDKNAAKLRARGGDGLIQIAGYCDERGTQEYNLALGERRALAVREYLIKMGVPGSRMITISYGEEVPANPGHDESAWAQNRRGVFNRAAQ